MRLVAGMIVGVLAGLPLWGCASTDVAAASASEPAAEARTATPSPPAAAAPDPLPSWNDTSAKRTIMAFVEDVTDPESRSYVEPADRVATLDNDGTLICEKPTYVQLLMFLERLSDKADDDPWLRSQQPYKAIIERDMDTLRSMDPRLLIKACVNAYAGETTERFEQEIAAFLGSTTHPRFGVGLTECVYTPMLELMAYLRDHDFRVFIVTAGGSPFVRRFSESVYGVRSDDVVGSSVDTTYTPSSNGPTLVRGTTVTVDDGPGKPVNIERHIGKRPILAVGNSNGDIEMLEWAHHPRRQPLRLLVHHDDERREYAYDEGAERALEQARRHGWVTISMRHDWGLVFGFQNDTDPG